MKKFIWNILLFLSIIVVVVLSVNQAYVELDKSDTDYTKKFSLISDKIQICNFGSSHGLFGYNYEDISDEYNCFNFGLTSQTLSYDYRIFQNYQDYIGEGTVVFITVSYFSLFGKEEIYWDDFESKNKRYYTILPSSLIKEYDVKTDIFVNYLSSLSVDTSVLVKTLLGKSVDNINGEQWEMAASDIDVVTDAKMAFGRHIEKNKFDDFGNRIKNQEEIDALYSLIDECYQKGAVPILVTTPYLSEYTSEVKKDSNFYAEFYSIINKVVSDTGVIYYDYAFDERFINEYSWFMDSDHLNKEGARNFVNILMEEVVYKRGYY